MGRCKYGEKTFPTSRNTNKLALSALGSDCMAGDNVKISRVGFSPCVPYVGSVI